ncbi:MAG: hypothetical protein ABIG90_00655 [bacterium]
MLVFASVFKFQQFFENLKREVVEVLYSDEQRFCSYCINPADLGVLNPTTGKILNFHSGNDDLFCEICYEIFRDNKFPERSYFDQEWNDYLSARPKLLFAYSGGLDSTVVLALLVESCRQKNIDLEIFTIKTGVKGSKTHNNIDAVLNWLNIRDNHFYVDIQDENQDSGVSTLNVYLQCFKAGILPCGKICNSIIDHVYQSIMQERGHKELITGGDTPKLNKFRKYSLFWEKSNGLVVVRGGYAFNLSKKFNRDFVEEHNIPWINPECGGYDTDCLVPGAFFRRKLQGNRKISLKKVISEFPIILDYLAERARFGVYDRNEALFLLTHVDIASLSSYEEFNQIS